MSEQYIPPKVWQWSEPTSGQFANINRPTAGAIFEQHLPKGEHDLQLYSLGTPNGAKITIMLEELLEIGLDKAAYDLFKINIMSGDQFGSDFVNINPNSKIPALLDYSGDKVLRVFESGSILLYLAEKFGAFLPKNLDERTECLSWLFWQMASTPYVGGGFGQIKGTQHFRNIQRYQTITNDTILSLRIDEKLTFLNAHPIKSFIINQISCNLQIQHVILNCYSISEIDYSALEMLEDVNQELQKLGISFHLSEVKGPIMDKLQASHLIHNLSGQIFLSHYQAVKQLAPNDFH